MKKKGISLNFEKKVFSTKLLKWYYKNRRLLPWRDQKDPYKIWVSEIILQQTRVEQGRSYYNDFIKRFPDIKTLAAANQDEVLKVWEGLGYYRRAIHMHFAAHQVLTQFNGTFPSNYEQIQMLKGVGEYTAAAIASIAFNEPIAVVDGNVIRVISRIFCLKEDVSKISTKNKIKSIANDIMDMNNAGDFNQAMMELGATVCLPKNPKCDECPVKDLCMAYKHGLANKLPMKKTKIKNKERYFLYSAIIKNGKILLVKRTKEDIWKGLYELPCMEFENKIKFYDTIEKLNSEGKSVLGPIKHVLSHRILFAGIYESKKNNRNLLKDEGVFVELTNLKKYPKPVLVNKLLDLLYENQ